VPIVDNIIRAVPTITAHARDLRDAPDERIHEYIEQFDADEALDAAERQIRQGDLG
jgi:4-phosphopantoate--beta-alanine ligase